MQEQKTNWQSLTEDDDQVKSRGKSTFNYNYFPIVLIWLLRLNQNGIIYSKHLMDSHT